MAQNIPRTPKVKGALKIGCLVPLLVIGVLAFYFFAYPALTPDKIRGNVLTMTLAPSKDGAPRLWVLTDSSFNYIMKTETPGRMSIGRECLFCNFRVYVYDPAKEKAVTRFDTPLKDIITVIDMAYADGKVWIIMGGYGKNDPRIEAYDPGTARLVMDTKAFMAKHPLLRGGLAAVYYNDKENTVSINTKDGLQGVKYSLETGDLFRDHGEWRQEIIKDETPASVAVMARDRSSGPRKKLVLVSGPRGKLADNASSLESYAGDEHSLVFFTGATGKLLTDKIFLEGIIYHQDEDCAIIIYLDQIGKQANRIMSCYDLATGRRKWTVPPGQMFKKMKIDEEDDSFSSLFFTKDNIKVRRLGNLVVLQLKGVGLIGFDYKTGKKLWTMDI
ncbi:MAG TPA: hypothetical protein PKX40_19965 [Spirochaetota bacterium]|nr:hypothetical protein [Spirochaetota bacterium]